MAVIVASIPFRRDRNLGRAYNEWMERLREDEWACFLDHDAMFTTSHWHAQLEEAIAFQPDAGCFAVTTNRIAPPWQKAPGAPASDDIMEHRRFGEARRKVRTLLDITGTKGFGGVLTLISKAAWREAGGYPHGMFCVDHGIHFRLRDKGRRLFLLEGLYVYHVRASSSAGPAPEALVVPNCSCRGVEEAPTERLQLP